MRKTLYLVALAVVVVMPASCLAGRKVFRRALPMVASMDPIKAGDTAASQVITQEYEPILDIDYYARPYKLKPCVCDFPQVSADGLVYTFQVIDGMKFRNGAQVKASDVKRCLDRLADKRNASSGMWLMHNVKSVDVTGPLTFTVTLKQPQHVFKWLMAMPYTGVVAEDGTGTGAYYLKEWRKSHEMVFERNPIYRDKVDIDEVRYMVVDDLSTQWLMFLSGEIDFLSSISRDNWDAVIAPDGTLVPELAARGMTLKASPSLSIYFIGFNMKDPVVGPNRKLRQALNCAFNFPAWKKFMNNRVLPCDGPLPIGMGGRLETPFAYSYDEEKAKRLLAEAGYPGGIDPKTGRRLSLELAIGRATQDMREMAELLAAFYDRVGVELTAKYMTWEAFLSAMNEGRVQLFNTGWVGDYPDPENFLMLLHTKNAAPGVNHGCYSNPEFDRAFEALDWKKAQEIVREDCPWIFLYTPRIYSLHWNKLENYVSTDFNHGTVKYFRLKEKEK
jgi:ABC-type transport system substrate-binding protein